MTTRTTLALIEDLPIHHVGPKKACATLKWTFIQAFSAEDGVTKVLGNEVDVALIDMNLASSYKGDVVAKKIRDKKPHILLFSYSGGSVDDEHYKGRSLWDGHLGKNGSVANLTEKVIPLLKI